MEQKTSDDNSSEQPGHASISPQPKKASYQPKENSLSSDATSNDAATIAGNLNEANDKSNQEPTNIEIADDQQPSKNGIYDFILASEEDSVEFANWRGLEQVSRGSPLCSNQGKITAWPLNLL